MSTPPGQESIQELAYQVWEERGRPAGTSEECWQEAERRSCEVRAKGVKATDDALEASFPASDPPASQIPDDVPVNAEDKWVAAAECTEPPAPLRMVREKKR
jgi:hypothetical protein